MQILFIFNRSILFLHDIIMLQTKMSRVAKVWMNMPIFSKCEPMNITFFTKTCLQVSFKYINFVTNSSRVYVIDQLKMSICTLTTKMSQEVGQFVLLCAVQCH